MGERWRNARRGLPNALTASTTMAMVRSTASMSSASRPPTTMKAALPPASPATIRTPTSRTVFSTATAVGHPWEWMIVSTIPVVSSARVQTTHRARYPRNALIFAHPRPPRAVTASAAAPFATIRDALRSSPIPRSRRSAMKTRFTTRPSVRGARSTPIAPARLIPMDASCALGKIRAIYHRPVGARRRAPMAKRRAMATLIAPTRSTARTAAASRRSSCYEASDLCWAPS